jgi:hypothetical protein
VHENHFIPFISKVEKVGKIDKAYGNKKEIIKLEFFMDTDNPE